MSLQVRQLIKGLALSVLRKIKLYRAFTYVPGGALSLEQLTYVTISAMRTYGPVKRVRPLTIDGDVYWKFMDKLEDTPQRTFVAKAAGWRVWGNQGAVITGKGYLFGDVSREFEKTRHSIFKQLKLAEPTRMSGTTAVINASGADMYYHWMFDILPRIQLLKNGGYTTGNIDHYVIDYRQIPFQDEALTMLNIPKTKISIASEVFNYHIIADKLVIPSLPSRLDEVSEGACLFLRDTFLDEQATSPFGAKLYLKRTGKREITNSAEIEAYLMRSGFEIVQCEQFTIKQQAAIFYNADVVIGPHGAAFSNTVFCKPGTKVVELFSPKWINPCYWTISNWLKLPYYYLIGEGGLPDKISDAKGTNAHITIDLEKLKTLISRYELLD